MYKTHRPWAPTAPVSVASWREMKTLLILSGLRLESKTLAPASTSFA